MKKPLRTAGCGFCSSQKGPNRNWRMNYEISDEGIYLYICPSCGKTSMSVDQILRYEVLCERGLLALADNAFNEAIVNFSVCLERFWEVILLSSYITTCGTSRNFETFWHKVRKQSERQRGAYEFVSSIRFVEDTNSWPDPPKFEDLSSFRNQVIHGGRIACREDCWNFCEQVFSWVRQCQIFLFDEDRSNWQEVSKYYIEPRMFRAKKILGDAEGTTSVGTAIATISSHQRPILNMTLTDAISKALLIYTRALDASGPPSIEPEIAIKKYLTSRHNP